MTSINKILLLFILVIFISFVGIWEFVQSEFFAGVLSKNVTKYTKEFLDADLKFERVNFKLLPPGVEINNVELTKKTNDKLSYSTQVSGLGISFNPFDLFETDLTIDKLYLNDGKLRVKYKSSMSNVEIKKSKKFEINFKISDLLKVIRAKLPLTIKHIELNKINLNYNENSIVTHKAQIELFKDHVDFEIMLRNFNLNKMGLYEEVLDEVYGKASFYDEIIEIQNLYMTKNMNKVELQGEIEEFQLLENAEWSIEGNISGNIKELHKYLDFSKIGKLNKGIANINFESEGSKEDYYFDANIKLNDMVTDFVNADKAEITVELNKENITFKQFKLEHKGGKLNLLKPFEFYNFKTNKFVEENIFVKASDLKMSNALRFLRANLGILKGKLNGEIEFILGSKDFHFIIAKPLMVDDLKLIVSKEKDSIINPTQIRLKKGSFDIVGDDVTIKLDASLDNSQFKTVGTIKNEEVKFDIKKGKIDLKDIGKISGFDIEGQGNLDLSVVTNNKKQEINIISNLSSFSFEGYKQEKIKSKINLDLKNSFLNINSFNAKTGQAITSGYFKLNLNDMSVDSKVYQEKFLLSEIKKMYAPAVAKLGVASDKVYGEWRTEVVLSGKLSLKELNLQGKFQGQNNFVYGESFDLVQLNYSIKNSIFNISDLYVTKANGAIQGGLSYNISNSDAVFWGNINKIPLVEINNFNKIPTNLKGKLSGIFKGNLKNDKVFLDAEINISDSKIHNKQIGNSYIKLTLAEDIISFDTSLLGSVFETNGKIYLKDKQKESSFKWKINTADINNTLSILTFVDHLKTGFSGQAYLGGEGSFKLNQIDKFSTKLNVEKLYLSKGKLDVRYENKGRDQIVVENGEIKNWNLNIRGKKFYIISKGDGNISDKYDIRTRVKSDATLLEIFNVLISKSNGTLLGSIHNFKNFYEEDYVAKLVSNNLTLRSDYAPLALSKGDLLINYKKKKFILNKLKAQLNSGELFVNGVVDISRVIPDINIRYEFKNAGIPLLKKSSITFSGKGSFVGKTIPYTLGGEFQIQKCIFVNEITDFVGGEEIAKSEIDYLPQNNSNALNQFLNLNLNINTLEPIRITNSMANLGFAGNVLITGGEKDHRVSGKISLAPIKNQIYFKNNVFNLIKGNIFFYERNKMTNPELDFQAKSVINKYNVNISLLGPLKDFKLDLNSDPILSQSDVLSLVAFGYTENLSTNLSDSEKESMTRAGVGSIIFDRFKINETLKNEFGLQVNLGTQISQDAGSYLSQKNAQGGGVGKVHSATTIQIKKQINEAVNLSVSSTVGGTIGQKQSMNLNYNLNKNLSVQGVYESNTQTQSEELTTDSSIGADMKIRWSFK